MSSRKTLTGTNRVMSALSVESRKDEEIARAVLDRLRAQGVLDAFQGDGYRLDDAIKIHVERGWIIVKGTVASKHLRTKIEDVIRGVAGVRGVSNRIRTKAVVATPRSRTNAETAPMAPGSRGGATKPWLNGDGRHAPAPGELSEHRRGGTYIGRPIVTSCV